MRLLALLVAFLLLCVAGSPTKRTKRMALRETVHLWPNGTIPFTFQLVSRQAGHQRVSVHTRRRVLAAMRIWAKDTCVRFVPWKGESQFANLVVRNDCLCCSDVGRQTTSATVAGVTASCDDGSVLHELGHVIGLLHTHDRPDRDEHVEFLTHNINARALWNFGKFNESEVTTRNFPYDFESVMHYHAYAFSANGQPTIVDREYPLDSAARTYRRRLSRGDVGFVNSLYGCKRKRCARTLESPQGRFQVPEYFALDRPCTWNFHIRPDERLLLRLSNIHTKLQNPCEQDWISLRTVGSRPLDTKLLARFCGYSKDQIEFRIYAPTGVSSNATVRVLLSFFSSAPRFHTGFSAEYDVSSRHKGNYDTTMVHYKHNRCNLIITSSNGTITSPFIPQYLRNDYPHIPSCSWHLKPLVNTGLRNLFRLDVFISRVISYRPFLLHDIERMLTPEHARLDTRECIGAISLLRKLNTSKQDVLSRFHYECNTEWLTEGNYKPTYVEEFKNLEQNTQLPDSDVLANVSFPRLRMDNYGAKLTFWIEATELQLRWYSLWHLPFEMHFKILTL